MAKKTAKKTLKRAVKKAAKKKVAKKSAKKTKTKKAPKKSAKSVNSTAAPSAATLLKVGAQAPNFTLPSDSGKPMSLADFKGKTVVLYFYPKDDTPGCTKESCDFRDSFSRVQAKGAVVLGVSKDSVKSHQKFKEKYSLPFALISDEKGKMIESYKVWQQKMNYGKKYMGIVRTTYLIHVDKAGVGTIWKVYPQVKVEGHVDEILQELG